MRFVTPAFMFATAAFVWWYNANHTGRVVMLPFIEVLVPSTEGDPARQGEVSAWIFAGLGVVFLLRAIWATVRSNQLREEMMDGLD